MMLNELVREAPAGINVSGISDDSRRIRPGDLFCAVSGARFDGRQFAAKAVENGAAAILAEPPLPDAAVPVIAVADLASALGEIASRFFGDPSSALQVFAVTGTNGKTSFTHLLSQALGTGGRRCGLVGTMGHGLPGQLREPGLTTPPAVDLQRRLKELLDEGCDAVVLEASSHGLVQGRLNGTQVDVAVLTNITHDHLDYHGSIEEYRRAKARLFAMASVKTAVINLGDAFAPELIREVASSKQVITYSIDSPDADVTAHSLRYNPDGITCVLRVGDSELEISASLFGEFNVENLLAVVAVLHGMSWSPSDIAAAVRNITPVAGRMEVVARAGKPTVIIDYAHTPDALEKSLAATRAHFKDADLTVVFGCGGDRDTLKRPMMGEIASRLADRVVLTSDNPRSEDPQAILEAIAAGVTTGSVLCEPDREKAILHAVRSAEAGDVVLVAGKGHEDYQDLATGRIPFSDAVVVSEAFNGKGT